MIYRTSPDRVIGSIVT